MKKRILILVNHEIVIYNFRKELVERLIDDGYEVIISSPYGEKIEILKKLGCQFIETNIERHGTNPLKEFKLLFLYKKIIRETKPNYIFTYTIKPNIYGGMAAKRAGVPYLANITGLGTAVEHSGIMQKITLKLYKIAFSKIQTVFFQNEENLNFFKNHNIALGTHKLLPGSGVNLKYFDIIDYPPNKTIEFVFISRIMKEKGIEQYLEAAKYIKEKYPFTRFHVCGFCEEDYGKVLQEYQKENIIIYHGMVLDIRNILSETHCTVHPTYYPEGLSNVLLESASCGRPVISTNRTGTKEVIDDGLNGYLINEKDTVDLIEKIEKFINISYFDKKQMGLLGRKKVEKNFDRNIVVQAYMDQIK